MATIRETLDRLDHINEAKKDQFAMFQFEHVNTRELIDALESQGYDVAGGTEGKILIGSLDENLAKKIQSIIWDDWNDGAWCEYTMMTPDEADQYL